MANRTPLSPPEAHLRHEERLERGRKYSYDLTKQLAFFVISAELVFCGYILLSAQTLKDVGHINTLFLLAGLAAIFGIFWRLAYNDMYHAATHNLKQRSFYFRAGTVGYWVFVGLSLIFFILLLVVGYNYLSGIEATADKQTFRPWR